MREFTAYLTVKLPLKDGENPVFYTIEDAEVVIKYTTERAQPDVGIMHGQPDEMEAFLICDDGKEFEVTNLIDDLFRLCSDNMDSA